MSRLAQGATASSLITIGELSEAAGVSPATLRVWEQRHDFPEPHRLESGHRRYATTDVALVRRVVDLRSSGMRLDVAIERAQRDAEAHHGQTKSVFAETRRLHPHLQPYRLKKSTLLALSWAIEDEFCAKAERPRLFGAFQKGSYYSHAEARWRELARVSRCTFAFADFEETSHDGRVVKVALDERDPMLREWSVICDAPGLAAALTAWEVPGQAGVPEPHRLFESIWTVDPAAVRDAARTITEVAHLRGAPEAAPVLYDLADHVETGVADLESVSTMFNRVVSYVDRYGG